MLVTDVRDEICWWRFWQFWSPASTIFLHERGRTFKRCHQDWNSVTKIKKNCHQLQVTNITIAALALLSFSLSSQFPPKKNRTSCIFREQDCTYEYILIYFSRYASRQHWAVYMNSTPSDEVTWENSTWNEHQLGSIHIIRILANHNRRNSSKFNEILRSKPILLCVILPRLGIVISGLILALSRICLMQR